MTKRISTSDRQRWLERDGPRAVLAAVLLIFVVATSLSDGKLLPDFSSRPTPVARTSPEPVEDLRTGSILITSADGNVCEQRVIDNETWRIRSAGRVACDAALRSRAERDGAYTPQSRLEAIRDGFVSKR